MIFKRWISSKIEVDPPSNHPIIWSPHHHFDFCGDHTIDGKFTRPSQLHKISHFGVFSPWNALALGLAAPETNYVTCVRQLSHIILSGQILWIIWGNYLALFSSVLCIAYRWWHYPTPSAHPLPKFTLDFTLYTQYWIVWNTFMGLAKHGTWKQNIARGKKHRHRQNITSFTILTGEVVGEVGEVIGEVGE